MSAGRSADSASMGHPYRRAIVGSAALVGATTLGLMSNSLLVALLCLAGASLFVFRGPLVVKDRDGELKPLDPTDPWQLANVVQAFALFVDAMFVLAALFGLAWAISSRF